MMHKLSFYLISLSLFLRFIFNTYKSTSALESEHEIPKINLQAVGISSSRHIDGNKKCDDKKLNCKKYFCILTHLMHEEKNNEVNV